MGGKTSTTTQSVSIPKEVMDRYNAINARAESVAGTPFQTYSEDPSKFVAQINPQQMQGINNVNASAGAYKPYFDQAALTFSQGMKSAQPGALNLEQFYNPFQQQVIDATMRQMGQANQQAQSGALGTAISSGAFGGDRAGIAAANLANQQGLAMGSTLAGLNAQNYNQALAAAQQQQGVYLGATQADLARLTQGGQFYAGLGQAAQQAGLQGAEAQINAGTLGQQTEQAGLSALYNQFQQKNAYPFQVSQFLANIGMGTGALSGSTTTTTQPGSFFSDRRLKEDVQRIGEGDNGLPIYKYRYKGEPDTHIGFMADEVEKVRPEAVGLHPTGYKTVDYDRATKAEGGVAGPYGSSVGSQPGVSGYVPQAYLPVGELMVADSSSLDHARQSLAQQLEAVANMGKNIRELDATWDWAKDNWGSDPKKEIVEGGQAPTKTWRGGVTGGYADGGAAYLNTGLREQNPVDKRTYLSDIVSAQEDAKRRDSLQSPGSVPQARTTGQDVADLAKVALAFMGMNRGGRTGYATRGGVSEEDMRRLNEMRPGDPTDILPSGVVPQPSRITKPVTYEPQAPSWKSIATTSPTPGAYEYDTNYGMVRDMATGQLLSNARSAVRNDTQGVSISENGARNAAIDRIEDQLNRDKSAASTEALRAQNLFDYASEVARQGGSYQDPRQQFPELYDAYREAQRRLDSANAVVMPSSITNRFGDQANYMIAEGYQPSAGMVTGVMPRDMGDEAPAIIPGSEAAPVRTGLSALPMTTDAMTPPGAQVQPSSLGFSGLRPASIEDAGISTGSIRPRARPANLDTTATVITPTGLRPQPRPDDLAARYATPVPTITAGLGGGGADRMPVTPAGLGSAAAPANVPAAPTVDGGVKGPEVPAVVMAPSNVPQTPVPAGQNAFDVAVGFTLKHEGGFNPRDANGYAVNFGVNQKWHPEVDVANLTEEGAREIYLRDYWRPINGDEIAQKYGQEMATAVFDTAVISGVQNAKELLAQSGGDVNKFLQLRADFLNGLVERNPSKYGPYVKAWNNRNLALGATNMLTGFGETGIGAPAERRTGLAAGLGNDKAYDERNMLGKMMYDPETNQLSRNGLLSLASGIGAMLSSPSQYFLPSLGLGLQGFAGTYAGLEKQAADIEQSKSQAYQARMEADARRFITTLGGMDIVNLGNGQYVYAADYLNDPTAYTTGDPELDKRIFEAAKFNEENRSSENAPSGEAGDIFQTPLMRGIFSDEFNAAKMNPAAAREQSAKIEEDAALLANAARIAVTSTLMQVGAVSNAVSNDAVLTTGQLGDIKQTIGAYLNDLVRTVNAITGSDLPTWDGSVANAELIRKAAIQSGLSVSTGAQELEVALSGQPGSKISPEANSALMASILLDQHRAMRFENFLRDFKVKGQENGNRFQTVKGASNAFQQLYGSQLLAEKDALKALIRHGSEATPEWQAAGLGYNTPMEFLMDPGVDPSVKNEVILGLLQDSKMGVSPMTINALTGPDGVMYIGNYFGG